MSVLNRHALVGLGLIASASAAAAEPALTDSNLNLRSGPGPAFAVLMVIPARSKVEVEKCNVEWCRLTYGGKRGYASRSFLNMGGDAFASAEAESETETEPSVANPTLSGPRIWRWDDRTWRDRHWRRLEWRNRHRRR